MIELGRRSYETPRRFYVTVYNQLFAIWATSLARAKQIAIDHRDHEGTPWVLADCDPLPAPWS